MKFNKIDVAGAANQLRAARAGMIDGVLINLFASQMSWQQHDLQLDLGHLANDAAVCLRRALSEKAVKVASTAPDATPLADILLYLSGDAIAAGDDNLAASLLEPALELGLARAHYLKAILCAQQGDDQEALDHLEAAGQIAPLFGSTNRQLGLAHLRRGNVVEASRWLDSAAALRDPPWEMVEVAADSPRLVARLGVKCEIYLYRGRFYPVLTDTKYMGVRPVLGRLYIVEQTLVYEVYRSVRRWWARGRALASRLENAVACFTRAQITRCKLFVNVFGDLMRAAPPLLMLGRFLRKWLGELEWCTIFRRHRSGDNLHPKAQPLFRRLARRLWRATGRFIGLIARALLRNPLLRPVLVSILATMAQPAAMRASTLPEALDLISQLEHRRTALVGIRIRHMLIRPVSVLFRRAVL